MAKKPFPPLPAAPKDKKAKNKSKKKAAPAKGVNPFAKPKGGSKPMPPMLGF